jgi:hypothetical protein
MKEFFSSSKGEGDSYKTEPSNKPGFFTQFRESFNNAYNERRQERYQREARTGAGAGLLANEGHTAAQPSEAKKSAPNSNK